MKPKLKTRMYRALFDDGRGNFSTTRMMNIIFFALAVATWVICLVAIVQEWKINSAFVGVFLGFVTTLTGGGFLQYSYAKKIRANGDSVKPGGIGIGEGTIVKKPENTPKKDLPVV